MMLASQLRNKPQLGFACQRKVKVVKFQAPALKVVSKMWPLGVDKNTKGWNEVKDDNQSIRKKNWDYDEDVGEMIEEEEDKE